MAQRVQVQLLDDITGEEAAETITFGLDGVMYEIDLTAQNARQLRDELGFYVEKGRKVRGRSAAQRRPKTSARDETHRIREWAEKNGYGPSSRGRISKNIMEAYQAANA
ncbi:Lsr2 family protein [Arthrobacter sp. NPDC097144]|uniref:histone-like nucleoid-structuring protein Lsr2 n=1 Tax=Arthrobacter sp. NPDC097144 TaxID=3363946 RepID=UPI00380A6885